MGWEADLFAFLEDLEGQAQAAYDEERDLELADRAAAEYAEVTLAARLMASKGRSVVLTLAGIGRVDGVLAAVGSGWCLLGGRGQEWLVATDHVVAVEGLDDRAVPEVAWRPHARLPLRSALRRLAGGDHKCTLHHREGMVVDAAIGRVGKDFVEVRTGRGGAELVNLASVVAVQGPARPD